VSWDREKVSTALVELLGPATGVKVHQYPLRIVNPPSVTVSDPSVSKNTGGYGIDVATVPLVVVCGYEDTAGAIAITGAIFSALGPSTNLGGAVFECHPTEERNWRNFTGAGGVQLLLVDVMVEVKM